MGNRAWWARAWRWWVFFSVDALYMGGLSRVLDMAERELERELKMEARDAGACCRKEHKSP